MVWDGVERRNINHKILYIDDDPCDLKVFKTICESKLLSCFTTFDTTEFLTEFHKGIYTIAFIDYQMPVDGVSLVQLIDRKKAPKTRIYIFSVHDRSYINEKLNGDKIDGIVSKEYYGFEKAIEKAMSNG